METGYGVLVFEACVVVSREYAGELAEHAANGLV